MRARTRRAHGTGRLRLVTYNVLFGGRRRESLITRTLERLDADVIALQEVCELSLLESLASRFHMEALVGEPSEAGSVMRTAILTRLPVRSWRNVQHRGRMLRGHLHCELETGGKEIPLIAVHCLHLAARFGERAKGEARRMRELSAVLEGIERGPELPHVLLGDFNSLSPGDTVAATRFFRRYNELRRAGLIVNGPNGTMVAVTRDGHNEAQVDAALRAAGIDERLIVGVPMLPRVIAPLMGSVPVSPALDGFLGRFIERWTMERVHSLGYIDAFRRVHPRAHGYTVATWLPSARVDYVLTTPDLSKRILNSDVVGSRTWPDPDAAVASDHFPVIADLVV